MQNSALNIPTLSQTLAGYPVLIVPGLNNSDADHWQSRWQALLPNSYRIELDTWATADLPKWCRAIEAALVAGDGPFIIIAHSFGALACARIAQIHGPKIRALFLVAPADPDKFLIAGQLPQQSLGVNATLIASNNDPWMQGDKAALWAKRWGADFHLVNNLGHINSASKLGLWPQGIIQLQALMHRP